MPVLPPGVFECLFNTICPFSNDLWKKKGDSPLFYILIILALKKVKDGKKGTVPFFLPAG